MRTIINKLKGLLDIAFYALVLWHIAVYHQPEPDVQPYAIIDLYEQGLYADQKHYICKDFILYEKGRLLGFHAKAYDAYIEGEIRCRYSLTRPLNWEVKLMEPTSY